MQGSCPAGIIGPSSQDQVRLIRLLDLRLRWFKNRAP